MQKIAELSRRGAAAELGYRNVAQVLRHAVRWDLKTARQWVARAEVLAREVTPSGSVLEAELPVTAVAVAEGSLSGEHISAVAEVMRELPPEAEAPVVEFAQAHEPSAVRAFGKELAYRLYQQDAEPQEVVEQAPVNRLRMEWKGEQLEMWAKLDKVAGAKFEAMIDPLAKPRPTTPEEGVDPRSRAEREGDAFADLIDLMLRADRLPEHGGEPVTLTLTMSYENLAGKTGFATLDNRVRVPATLVRRLACNAGVIPVVLGGRSEAVDIGRKARTFPAAIRRLLVARDQGCTFPGCDRPPKHCDAHHVKFWSEGGETSVNNAALLCRHHHTLIHQSDWEVKLHNGIPTFVPPAWLDPDRTPRTNTTHRAGRHAA
ncbi:HNH endonuclease signature motif containing protein [Lentzea sp. HUAS12]|uniref:HNH endonuclease signature motif containing protein n=1 Tax=Lentzea sp. HUAS12 TaxID=2951806 RepID=UPI00209CBA6D|nr:HNH endonuclease signature motif containing protein [Lentzea sp. HUAS12]USX52148.1 HNH endonuclease [Lentzea sp. HUAS12]